MKFFNDIKTFLNAFTKSDNYVLNHLNHPEENVFYPQTFIHTHKTLMSMNKVLKSNRKNKKLSITVKADGSPSIVFGYHPLNNKFFVGTKSVFNKVPKINYTFDDIEKNHGHSKGLVAKLKNALIYLPKITNSGIYQGDILFDDTDKKYINDSIVFTPNTITYKINKDNSEYKSIDVAKFGIAIHTKYTGTPLDVNTLEGINSDFNIEQNDLGYNVEVYQSTLEFNHLDIKHNDYINIKTKLIKSKKLYNQFSKEELDIIEFNRDMFKTYVNSKIRKNEYNFSVNEYYEYSKTKLEKEVIKMKSDAGKYKKQLIKDEFLDNIINNFTVLDKAILIHNYIMNIKNDIIDSMNNSNHKFNHYINDTETNPEGYVVSKNGIPIKLVHRHEFSKLNFLNSVNR